MKTSESLKEFAPALAKAQAMIRPAAKDASNTYHKSKYADLASVWGACRSALTEHGFSVVQSPATTTKVEPGIVRPSQGQDRSPRFASFATVTITTRLLHASGEWVEGEFAMEALDASPQSIGSAITYGRRYGLAAMAGVAPDDDDDGQAATARGPERESRPAPRPNGHAVGGGPSDADLVGAWQTYATHVVGVFGLAWKLEMDREGVAADRREDLANAHQLTNHLCSLAIEKGTVKPEAVEKGGKPGVRDPGRVRVAVARLYARNHEAVEAKAREYLGRKRSELRLKLGMPDFDEEGTGAGEGSGAGEMEHEPGMRG